MCERERQTKRERQRERGKISIEKERKNPKKGKEGNDSKKRKEKYFDIFRLGREVENIQYADNYYSKEVISLFFLFDFLIYYCFNFFRNGLHDTIGMLFRWIKN